MGPGAAAGERRAARRGAATGGLRRRMRSRATLLLEARMFGPRLGRGASSGAMRPASCRLHAARIASRHGTRPFARKRDPARREGAARRREVAARTNVSRETSARTHARRVIERAAASRARLRCAVFTHMLRIRPSCGPVPFRSGAFSQVALRRVASFRSRCRKYRNMWVNTARKRSGRAGSTEGYAPNRRVRTNVLRGASQPLIRRLWAQDAVGSRDASRLLPLCRLPVEHAPHHLVTCATCNRHACRAGARYDRFNDN